MSLMLELRRNVEPQKEDGRKKLSLIDIEV